MTKNIRATISKIDADLWRRAKVAAAEADIDLWEWISQAFLEKLGRKK